MKVVCTVWVGALIVTRIKQLKEPFDTYLIYSDGRVQNKNTGKFLSPFKINSGYLVYHLYANHREHKFLIHRLVAEYFVPNPNNELVVNHIDGDRLNNNYTNLEWTSQKDNLFKAHANGHMSNRYVHPYELYCPDTGEDFIFASIRSAFKYIAIDEKQYKINQILRTELRNSKGEWLVILDSDWYIRLCIEHTLLEFSWSED